MSKIEGTGGIMPPNPPIQPQEDVSVISLLNSDDQIALELGGDTQAQLAAMVIKHGAERRENLDEAKGRQEQFVRERQQDQVYNMRSEAEHIRNQAQTEGWTQIAASGFQFAGAVSGSGEGGDALEAMGNAYTGWGKMVAAGEGLKAGMAHADATAADHRAQEGLRRIDALLEDIDGLKDFEAAGMEFVKTVQDIRAETNKALLFERV